MAEEEDEGYRGGGWLVAGPAEIPVSVHLSGHFDPLIGSYRWWGRLDQHAEVTALYQAGRRHVALRVPGGRETEGTLDTLNAWGGARITGTGLPPFLLPEEQAGVETDV